MKSKKGSIVWKALCFLVVGTFVVTAMSYHLLKVSNADASVLSLPSPTQLIDLSKAEEQMLLRGVQINPKNPLQIDFIVDDGLNKYSNKKRKAKLRKLINYFLTALTVPEKDLWVNLSPYESDRIIPTGLSQTSMGRDMLATDYLLKQLSSSLTHPDRELGNEYWNGILLSGKHDLSKVWIVPDQVNLYVDRTRAVIGDAKLKVLTEVDYVASDSKQGIDTAKSSLDILLPTLSKEINEGRNFIRLRQIYHSLILASWFKKIVSQSLYKHYINEHKFSGIKIDEKNIKDKLFNMYCKSFEKGVYDLVKKENDGTRRRYYSGGLVLSVSSAIMHHPLNEVSDIKATHIDSVELKSITAASSIEVDKQLNSEPVQNLLFNEYGTLLGAGGISKIFKSLVNMLIIVKSYMAVFPIVYEILFHISSLDVFWAVKGLFLAYWLNFFIPFGLGDVLGKRYPLSKESIDIKIKKELEPLNRDLITDNKSNMARASLSYDGLIGSYNFSTINHGGKLSLEQKKYIILPQPMRFLSGGVIRYLVKRRAEGFDYLRIQDEFKKEYVNDQEIVDKIFESAWIHYSGISGIKGLKYYPMAVPYVVLWFLLKGLSNSFQYFKIIKKYGETEIFKRWHHIFIRGEYDELAWRGLEDHEPGFSTDFISANQIDLEKEIIKSIEVDKSDIPSEIANDGDKSSSSVHKKVGGIDLSMKEFDMTEIGVSSAISFSDIDLPVKPEDFQGFTFSFLKSKKIDENKMVLMRK